LKKKKRKLQKVTTIIYIYICKLRIGVFNELNQEGQDRHKKRMSKIPFLVSKTSKTKNTPYSP